MFDDPLFDDDLDDPELLAAMALAFGESDEAEGEGPEPTGDTDVPASEVVDYDQTLEALIAKLDHAMESIHDESQQVAAPVETNNADVIEEVRYVLFESGGQLAAFPLSGIVEIERLPAYTILPHTPAWCLGIANMRGEIVSVTDLAALTETPSRIDPTGQKVIIVRSQDADATTAVVVDRVIGIRSFPAGITKRPDDLKSPLAQLAENIARVENKHVLLVEPDRLLAHPSMQSYMTA